MHRFVPIYAAWYGARITEMPVSHKPRLHGKSKYGLERIIKVVLDLMVVRFLDRWIGKPIYMFGGFGTAVARRRRRSARLYMLYLKIFEHVSMILTPLPLLVAMSVMMGMMSICIGLVAEIVVRTYFESQGKSIYHVRELINLDRAPSQHSAADRPHVRPDRVRRRRRARGSAGDGGRDRASRPRRRRLPYRARTRAFISASAASRSSTSPAAISRCGTRMLPSASCSTARSTTRRSLRAELLAARPRLPHRPFRHRSPGARLRGVGRGPARPAERHVRLRRLGPPAPAPVRRARPVRRKAVLLHRLARLLRLRLRAVRADPPSRRRPHDRPRALQKFFAYGYIPAPERALSRYPQAARRLLA